MSDLRSKIQKVRAQFGANKDFFTKDDFMKRKKKKLFLLINELLVFRALRPEYALEDDEIADIFEMTDENQVC